MPCQPRPLWSPLCGPPLWSLLLVVSPLSGSSLLLLRTVWWWFASRPIPTIFSEAGDSGDRARGGPPPNTQVRAISYRTFIALLVCIHCAFIVHSFRNQCASKSTASQRKTLTWRSPRRLQLADSRAPRAYEEHPGDRYDRDYLEGSSRTHGERFTRPGSCGIRLGSSPHARGALVLVGLRSLGVGLIPAHAGNISAQHRRRLPRRAHPRARGEHRGGRYRHPGFEGSSPHARGAQLFLGEQVQHVGLIPARAGSTVLACGDRFAIGAHPRTRGEHSRSDAPATPQSGSSPHARGAPSPISSTRSSRGLIPARAGSTPAGPCDLRLVGAHPRTRGEHCPRYQQKSAPSGSSPHARGARQRVPGAVRVPGLIPARAGSTIP